MNIKLSEANIWNKSKDLPTYITGQIKISHLMLLIHFSLFILTTNTVIRKMFDVTQNIKI